MALVELAKYYNVFEASLARARLEAAEVPSILFDTETNWGGFDLGVVPVRLMVDEEDLAAAQLILSEGADGAG
jgi:Putative prokaryotic signal transducing protein